MEFNETTLRKIISRVLEEMEETSVPILYVVLTEAITYPLGLFESLYIQQDYKVVILYDECLDIEKNREIFPEKSNFTYVQQSSITEPPLGVFESLFPMFNKTLIAKTALGVGDTFATKWIEHCFEQGQKVSILKSGMQMLTGKEPAGYQRTFQKYVKTLADYEINIIDKMADMSFHKQAERKIITYQDVFNFQGSEIKLDRQDIITDLAKEKAQELGIIIKY